MFARRALLGRTTALRSALVARHPGCGSNAHALLCERRDFGQLFSNLATHSLQVQGCASLSTLLYSPLGTVMLVVLAYNVVVIGSKHVIYTMEITGKDYVQDQQLHMIMKYGITACVLLAMEVLFVEV
ncbi:succinate dehydrogenase cytochrome B subunit [Trypanosoma cruzi]|nr:succinate dehydrogenase cytochrome B subunit [Trypanosoma cruzi]